MTIKEMRTQTGLTQQGFGDLLKIPRRTIQEWENGRRNPPEYIIDLIEYKLKNEGLIEGGADYEKKEL